MALCRFDSTFVEPMSHTILNGLTRSFLGLICDTTNGLRVNGELFHLKPATQARMDRLIKRLRFPSAYNRPACQLRGGCVDFHCTAIQQPVVRITQVIACRRAQIDIAHRLPGLLMAGCACRDAKISGWLFEESHTFLEVSGALAMWVVRAEVHPDILQMWGHLRTYALYFLHYRSGQHTVPQIRAAQNELFQYAEFAEQHLRGKLLTVLLHRAVVHIPEQVINGLPGAYVREDWGERCVRRTKGGITGHATAKVAAASAALCCTEMGLEISRRESPELHDPIVAALPSASSRLEDEGDAYGVMLHTLKPGNTGVEGDEVCVHLL